MLGVSQLGFLLYRRAICRHSVILIPSLRLNRRRTFLFLCFCHLVFFHLVPVKLKNHDEEHRMSPELGTRKMML